MMDYLRGRSENLGFQSNRREQGENAKVGRMMERLRLLPE
jgi:hypothetical protein